MNFHLTLLWKNPPNTVGLVKYRLNIFPARSNHELPSRKASMARHWIQGQNPLGRIYSSCCIVNWETVKRRREVKLCGLNIAVWRKIFKITSYSKVMHLRLSFHVEVLLSVSAAPTRCHSISLLPLPILSFPKRNGLAWVKKDNSCSHYIL